MKKIKFLLFLTIFTLFLGISNVSAKTTVGVCDYGDRTLTLYSDRTLYVSEKTFETKFHIGDDLGVFINRIYDKGICYKYMCLNKTGRNTASFSDDSCVGEKYELTEVPGADCYYDISYYEDNEHQDHKFFVRLHLKVQKNGSRLLASTLTSDNNYASIEVTDDNTKVQSFKADENGGVYTYYLTKPETIHFVFDSYSGSSALDIYNALKDGTCPTLTFHNMDNSGVKVALDGTENLMDMENWRTVRPQSQYRVQLSDGSIEDKEDTDMSDSNLDFQCYKNGKVQVIGNWNGTTPQYDGTTQFNFMLKGENGETQYCVEGDTGYNCTTGTNGYLNRTYVEVKRITSMGVHFSLDTDAREYIESQKDKEKFECPSFVGAWYQNNGSIEYSNFMITFDPDKAEIQFDDGEIDEPHSSSELDPSESGTPVYDCKGLIGDNVLAFLTLILKLIRIIGPILALVLGMWDLFMAMVNGEDDAKKKAMKKLKGRIIAAVLLLLLPYLLDMLLHLVNKTGTNCIPH